MVLYSWSFTILSAWQDWQKPDSKLGLQVTVEFFKPNFIGIYLLYRVALVSTVQQKESAIHIHINIFPPFWISLLGHHSELSRVPCFIQYILISNLSYAQYQ